MKAPSDKGTKIAALNYRTKNRHRSKQISLFPIYNTNAVFVSIGLDATSFCLAVLCADHYEIQARLIWRFGRIVMKKILLASVAAAAIGAASCAYAADLPSRQPAYEPPPPPPFSWTGIYLGANVGVGAGQTTWKDTAGNFLFGDIDGNNFGNTANTSQSGGVYGGQIGFNYEFAGSWVVGLEGQFSGSNIVGTNVDQFNNAWSLRNDTGWFSSVTGRVGYAIDHVLLYGKGGVAWAHNSLEFTNAGFNIGTGSFTRTGWTAGVGLEWAFAPNWSFVLEGNYYDFGNNTSFFAGNLLGAQTPFGAQTRQTAETLTAGVNYHFNFWAPAPVVAKY